MCHFCSSCSGPTHFKGPKHFRISAKIHVCVLAGIVCPWPGSMGGTPMDLLKLSGRTERGIGTLDHCQFTLHPFIVALGSVGRANSHGCPHLHDHCPPPRHCTSCKSDTSYSLKQKTSAYILEHLKEPGSTAAEQGGECTFAPPLRTNIVSFQSISDLNGAIASLADWGLKISC